MKRILLSLMLLGSLKAMSQTVDTSIRSITAVKINPIVLQVNYPKKDTCTHLGVLVLNDDLSTTATVQFILLANGKNIVVATDVISGEAYSAWTDNLYPFKYIANKYGYTFK